MGSTGTPTKLGSGIGEVMGVSKGGRLLVVIADITMSASYANPGGDTVTLDTDVKGFRFAGLVILNDKDGTRMYSWNGNKTTPKILALTGVATEVANTTNLSAVTLTVAFIYQGA